MRRAGGVLHPDTDDFTLIGDLEITTRLATAAVLGGAIGFERERQLWAAGIRTHMLVSVGACLVMIVSAYGFQHVLSEPHVILDPSRVAAQVVSGIGFLGAGAILLRGEVVRGLTTAASTWAVAAVGLAAGGGLYFAATIATAIILAILAGLKPIEEAYRARAQACTLSAVAEPGVITAGNLKKLLGLRMSKVRRVMITDVDGGARQAANIWLVRVSHDEVSRGLRRLQETEGVERAEVVSRRRQAAE